MKDYGSWSDQQIATEVAIRINGTGLLPARLLGRNLYRITLDDFDPCNNPTDAWRIMIHYGIATVVEDGIIIGATNNSQEYYEGFGSVIHYHNGTNPLKSAMIVFLMMTEKLT